jgi:hypothetical protein
MRAFDRLNRLEGSSATWRILTRRSNTPRADISAGTLCHQAPVRSGVRSGHDSSRFRTFTAEHAGRANAGFHKGRAPPVIAAIPQEHPPRIARLPIMRAEISTCPAISRPCLAPLFGVPPVLVTTQVNSWQELHKLFLRKQFVRKGGEFVCLNGASSFAA